METKRCLRCNTDQPISKYRIIAKKWLANICRTCVNIQYKKGRSPHREKQNKVNKEKRAIKKIRAIEYKGGKCTKCNGVFHPSVYDFHHINPKEKEYPLAQLMAYDDSILFKELDKCILLCSNCHREVHHANP